MEARMEEKDGITVLMIKGRLDTTNVEQFQSDIDPLMKCEHPNIEIDCAELEYTSSQGLRSFLSLQKSVNQRGGTMLMKNMHPQVKEVFDITGFSNIIKII